MDVNIDVDISQLEEMFDKVSKDIEQLSGENNIELDEMFNPSFMEEFTLFSSIDGFFEDLDNDINSKEDLEDVPEEIMDNHVVENTKFSDWSHMKEMAGKEWLKRHFSGF